MSKAFIQEPSSQVLRAPFNPYIAGNPVKGQDGFFGRDDIFREVLQMLRHPQSNAIVLYGQRRIGKTSVLLELERRLASEGEFTPISFDLQNKAAEPLAELLYELAQRIATGTGQAAPEHANFDSGGVYFRLTFLPLAAQAAGRGGLVLLFDEFDVFDGPEPSQSSKAFFPYLRDWMAGVEGVHFVFVIGRLPEDLSIETMSTFKGVRAAQVSLLEREAAEAVVRKSERDGSLVWTDTTCEKVWDWAQGHPYFTQLLCGVVWENAHDDVRESTPSVSVGDVDAAIDEALQQGANAFHWVWDGLPPAERVVMAAMAEAGDAMITLDMLKDILNRSGVRIIGRELTLAPDTLVNWSLLRSADGGYRFVVPLLRRWVASNRPLLRVKDEIDRLDPLAESLFQTGKRFYSIGQPTDAEPLLQQAIRTNPNHLKSRLLLGRILLESNKAVKSVAILEEAYKYDRGAARADLIKSLLATADGHVEAEHLATYERILEIDPHQPVARERCQAIWIAQGELAARQKQWKDAVEAFQKAGDLARIEKVLQLKRKNDLRIRIKNAERLEAEENWDAAATIYQGLLQEYPNESVLYERLENAQFQEWLLQLYNEAIVALATGDTKTAQRLLSKVINERPDYKEAARYLLCATTGLDIERLKAELTVERTAVRTAVRKKDEELVLGAKTTRNELVAIRKKNQELKWMLAKPYAIAVAIGMVVTLFGSGGAWFALRNYVALPAIHNGRPGVTAPTKAPVSPSPQSSPPPLRMMPFETVKLDARGQEIEWKHLQSEGVVEDLGGGVVLELVKIAGGVFTMGSSEGGNESPPHQVSLGGFWMGRYEITREQWREVADLREIKQQRDLPEDPSRFVDSWQQPVVNVSWEEAVEFCARLSRKTGKTYRLPTEAEWEYAARSGTSTHFAFGQTITPLIVNYDGNHPYGSVPKGVFRQKPEVVGSLDVANAFGLYDMHGNVWEWCSDLFDENYYSECKRQGTLYNPLGPNSGSSRVFRGCGWKARAVDCRSANRNVGGPGYRDDTLGLRIVREG